MKTKKMGISGVVAGLFELFIGILLLINPVGFTLGIIVAFGAFLCVMGVASVISYVRAEPLLAMGSQKLQKGLVYVAGGIFCICKSNWFVATFPILTILYGITILVTGFGKIQLTVDMLRLKWKRWYLAAISAVLSLICAAVILLNPFTTTTMLWIFTGVTLIVDAVFDIITVIFGKAKEEKKDMTEV